MTGKKRRLNESILRAYDIRGLVGDALYPEDAFAIGRAFVTIATHRLGRHPRLSVAYDGRVSSPVLESELVRGMLCSGADVVRVGLGPTPMLYFSIVSLERDGGIMVTGSHNPPNFNGFKLVLEGMPFWDKDIQYLGRVIADGKYVEGIGGITEFKVENGQPYLIEIAARGAGGSISSKIIPYLTGFDPLTAMLNQLQGQEVDVNFDDYKKRYAVLKFFNFRPGKVKAVHTNERLISNLLEHQLDLSPGDNIVPPMDSRDRTGYFIVHGENRELVLKQEKEVEASTRIEYHA